MARHSDVTEKEIIDAVIVIENVGKNPYPALLE